MRVRSEFAESDHRATVLHQHEALPVSPCLVEERAEGSGVERELHAGRLRGPRPAIINVRALDATAIPSRSIGTWRSAGSSTLAGCNLRSPSICTGRWSVPEPDRTASARSTPGDDIYVASGYFGLEHMSLIEPPSIFASTEP